MRLPARVVAKAANAAYHPSVHSMGNVGIGGTMQALLLPAVWFFIQTCAWGGVCARTMALAAVPCAVPTAVDIGCSTGRMTRLLARHGAQRVIGIDASAEMLRFARRDRGVDYVVANVCVDDLPRADLVTFAFVLHEMPVDAQYIALHSALRCLRGKGAVCIVDIEPAIVESGDVATGHEPFLASYASVDRVIASVARSHGRRMKTSAVVPHKCRVWIVS